MKFFYGVENTEFCKKLYQFRLVKEGNEKLSDYLESHKCKTLLQRKKMSTHFETGNTFFTKQILVKVFTTFWMLNKIIAKKRWNLNLIFLQIMNLVCQYLVAIKKIQTIANEIC